MMIELSLNVLDIVQNSIHAGASLIKITVAINTSKDNLLIEIEDNGQGMSKEQVEKVSDPFFTTRTTRNIGLGLPFFKYAAISTGGSFHIYSSLGEGTRVNGSFTLSHIDRMPLGDMPSTIHTLITFNKNIDFFYSYTVNDKIFVLDTREFRKILLDVPLEAPEISNYIKDYLRENQDEVNDGQYF